MGTAAKKVDQHGAPASALLIALLALACPASAQAQAAGATQDAAASEAASRPTPAAAAAAAEEERRTVSWPIPVVRIGGVVAYDMRREWLQEQKRNQKGLRATLNLSTNTYIWEPWIAQLGGVLGVTATRNNSDGNETGRQQSNRSASVIMTGSANLSVLPRSTFPFEAHIDRSNSRVDTDFALGNAYASQRYGFSQHFLRPEGDTMLGWDRNTQTGEGGWRDRQDSWRLSASHSKGAQRLQLGGDGSTNTHEQTRESATQKNLSLQHGYVPDPALTVDSQANITRSGFHLQQADSQTRLIQLSSLAMWRPPDQDLTVTGGARVFALDVDTSGAALGASAFGARIRNANLNLGANYDYSREIRFNASANLNKSDSNGVRSVVANESAGASYQPPSIELGEFTYGWMSALQASNTSGGRDAMRQFMLQLNHHVARTVRFDSGAALNLSGSQSLSAVKSSAGLAGTSNQLTNSGSVSWNMAQDGAATAVLRLSASDTRALGNSQEYFQMINAQATSTLVAGAYSGWSANLTIQSVRQSSNMSGMAGDPLSGQPINADPLGGQSQPQGRTFVTTSSGSISYQNQRMFGIARLRFGSDLRMNSQALLPLLGKAEDQAMAVWENRFNYAIGRTQVSLSLMISRSAVPTGGRRAGPVSPNEPSVQMTNRAVMFYLSRGFGNF